MAAERIEVRIQPPQGPPVSHWHATAAGAWQCLRHLRNALPKEWTVTMHEGDAAEPRASNRSPERP